MASNFERIGWGVAENSRHDVGTDLWVMARDDRLFDLGLLVGVQVKAGTTYFDEPKFDDDGEMLGWWFRDSDRAHVDAWLSHSVPHLVVLHDLETRVSYWAHVTAETVVSTGKGAKILVPRTATIDAEHRTALLAVAGAARRRVQWEGVAWTGAAGLLPRDVLRYALTVPRVVAPHRNASPSKPLTAPQAVALLMQARVHEAEDLARSSEVVTSLEEALSSDIWDWRFVGALARRVTTGDVDVLRMPLDDAPGPEERAAATVAAAAGLLDEARADEALELLETALEVDESEPLDHAWLLLQHARACAQVGRIDDAHSEALGVQDIRVSHADNIFASALGGAADALVFSLAGWRTGDIGRVVAGMDNTANWWRAQTISRALQDSLERTFKEWSETPTEVTFARSDEANNQLLAASMTANNLGDHFAWRQASRLLGQDALIRFDRSSNSAETADALRMLIRAGLVDLTKRATRELVTNGPAVAVRAVASEIMLDKVTLTTAAASLELLRVGGDVVDEVTANETVQWTLRTLRDPSAFLERTTTGTDRTDRSLVDVLAAVVSAASAASCRSVCRYVTSLPAQPDQVLATAWGRVVRALPLQTWGLEDLTAALNSADAHHRTLELELLGVVSRHNEAAARDKLVAEALSGKLDALTALGNIENIPEGAVHEIIAQLASKLADDIASAKRHTYHMWGIDWARTLTVFNLNYPEYANWDVLSEFLREPVVRGGQKKRALQTLERASEQLSAELRERFGLIALNVVAQLAGNAGTFFDPLSDPGDAIGAAIALAITTGAMDEAATAEHVLPLLTGSPASRVWAARIASRLVRPEDVGILASLVADNSPMVRSTASAALGSLVRENKGGVLAEHALLAAVSDPGTWAPVAAANGLIGATNRTAVLDQALGLLTTHISAAVRQTAAEVSETVAG